MLTRREDDEDTRQQRWDAISSMYIPENLGLYADFTDLSTEFVQINKLTEQYEGLFRGIYSEPEVTLLELQNKLTEAEIDKLIIKVEKKYGW